MNVLDLLPKQDKPIATKNLLNANARVTILRINAGTTLQAHQSKVDACLVLVEGEVVYDEAERSVSLSNVGDVVMIPAKVTHKVRGIADAVLLLVQ